MGTWAALSSNQLVDHSSLQDAVNNSIFTLQSGATIPVDDQCTTSSEVATLVNVDTTQLPTTGNQLVIKSMLVATNTVNTILVFDIYAASTAEIYCYLNTVTPGFTVSGVQSRMNFSPDGQPAADCYMIASDLMTFNGTTGYRFEVNMSKMLNDFPSISSFRIDFEGWDVSPVATTSNSGIHSYQNLQMVMNGTTGSYTCGLNYADTPTLNSTSCRLFGGSTGGTALTSAQTFIYYVYDRASGTLTPTVLNS